MPNTYVEEKPPRMYCLKIICHGSETHTTAHHEPLLHVPFIRLRALAMGRLTPGRQLMEVVVDEGRNVWLRFRDRSADELPIK
eukprot:scaffold115950_cov21-Tisochrysis_lutea.AAC.1